MNNTNVLKYTSLQQGIFHVLCQTAGTKINQRTLATKLKVTPSAISRALPALEQDNSIIVKEDKVMNLKEIQLNRENYRAVQLKRVENLRALYLSGCVDFLAETYAGATIILFGSYSRGEDTASSDIDIGVFEAKEKKINLASYEKQLARPIRLMVVTSLDKLSKEFKENILNGIVLIGGITL